MVFPEGGISMQSELTNMVLRYQKIYQSPVQRDKKTAERLFRVIEKRICLIIYQYPVRTRVIDEELASALLLSMKPRIPTIVTTFTYSEMSFENFIRRVAYMQAQVFAKRVKYKKAREICMSIPSENFDNGQIADATLPYFSDISDDCMWSATQPCCKKIQERINKSPSFKRKFLQLVLLCADCLRSDHITFLAQFLHLDEMQLAQLLKRARELSEERRHRVAHIKEVRDHHFYDALFYQREITLLQRSGASDEVINKSRLRWEREMMLFHERRDEVAQRSNPITHEVVGKLTEVPKGTVDSGLNSIKQYLKEIMDG
jgi:hypothetical protein